MRERLLREVDVSKKQLSCASRQKRRKLKLSKCMTRITVHKPLRVKAVKYKQTPKKDQQNKPKVNEKDKANTFDCKRCGTEHASRKCPAYGKRCKNCEKMNHFARIYRSRKVHAVDDEDVAEQQANLFVGAVHLNTQAQTDEWTVELEFVSNSSLILVRKPM